MSRPFSTAQLHDPSQPPPTPGRTAAGGLQVPPSSPEVPGKNAFTSERPQVGVPQLTEGLMNAECPQGASSCKGGISTGSQPAEGHRTAYNSDRPQGGTQGSVAQPAEGHRNAFNSERPLGVTPAPEGGVAIGGQPNLPEGRASMADKIVGKTEKVIGKVMNNPEMHERGELRETGGKAAAEGRARAAHD